MSLENKVKVEMKKIEKTLIIPDMHCPYEDYRALHGVYQFIKEYKPDRIIQLGDMVDFYALSRFSKDPDRLTGLQGEIDVARYHLEQIRKVHKGELVVLEGNHEARLQKYLMNNPEFSSIRAVNKVEKLLGMDDFDVKYRKNYTMSGFLWKHGHLVRKNSAYTARGEFEAEGTSGGSGHTHRMGSHYKTNRSGAHAWFEFGHICDPSKAEYMEGKVPDWQAGFGIFEIDKSRKLWSVQQHVITNNSFIADGKVYKWNKSASYPERVALG